MSIKTRLAKLEEKHAGPIRIWVGIGDGPYQSYNEITRRMESLSGEEVEARYPGDTLVHVRFVEPGAGPDQLDGDRW